jgi:hypothetical protein
MSPDDIDSLHADTLKGLVLSLLTRIDDLVEQNKILLARIAELEDRAGKPPTNSSVPSHGQKANVAGASGKKGSRKGRPSATRELCSNPDVTRRIYAERCTCGKKLSASSQALARAYDHVELTTRINLHRAGCPCCGKAITARGTRRHAAWLPVRSRHHSAGATARLSDIVAGGS